MIFLHVVLLLFVEIKALLGLCYMFVNIRQKIKFLCLCLCLVRPLVEYASPVWSPNTDDSICKIEMVQRRAARWTLDNYFRQASVTEMLAQLGWRSLEQKRNDSRLCLFYKIIHGLVAIDLPPYVEHPTRISRNSHPLVFRQLHTGRDYYKYSFYPLAIVQWNRLPENVALLPTFESFKRAVCMISHPMP